MLFISEFESSERNTEGVIIIDKLKFIYCNNPYYKLASILEIKSIVFSDHLPTTDQTDSSTKYQALSLEREKKTSLTPASTSSSL